jgi:hypothetical protein
MLAPIASVAVRDVSRFCGRLTGRERASFARLRAKAAEVRAEYIGKPVRKGNVAVLEHFSLALQVSIEVAATSRDKSPTPLPRPRLQGGYFEPSFDPSTGRLMNTDAEYKALTDLARRLDEMPAWQRVGVVYLFSERQPCSSCTDVIAQFKERFPMVCIVVEFDHPFP